MKNAIKTKIKLQYSWRISSEPVVNHSAIGSFIGDLGQNVYKKEIISIELLEWLAARAALTSGHMVLALQSQTRETTALHGTTHDHRRDLARLASHVIRPCKMQMAPSIFRLFRVWGRGKRGILILQSLLQT